MNKYNRISPAWLYLLLFFLLAGASAIGQTVTTGKSYINISRPSGGTFLPGDIIEMRATIAVSGGTVTQLRYNDTIDLVHFDYVPGSLQLISNEGRLQKQFTDANNDDAATINGNHIRFTIGDSPGNADLPAQGNSSTNSGSLNSSSSRPSFYSSTCIRVYAYRIRIKTDPALVAIDSLLTLYAGNFRYRIGSTDYISAFPTYHIRISPDYGLCANSIGGNAILGEFGGTFGSGTAQNRGATSFVPAPYAYQAFASGAPVDNNYGVANRTSSDGSINPSVAYPHASRVFNVWDIIGDHTGAADPKSGNPPSTNGGYAVIINASYETNRAFSQTISGLCEETYYEFSAWFRNICRRCGCDSSGKGSGSAGYVPGPGNDSSGVKPNLTFQIDGEDYYTSGNIDYTGFWEKKGFVYKTKPGQTSFTVTIRNNAPGGGGNDWAIDDIAVATCLPNMNYSPSLTPNICEGAPLKLYDTVRSYFNNYVYYQWQNSTNGGSTWNNLGDPAGPVTPTWNGTAWEYVSSYTIPPENTTKADSGTLYRLIVATSLSNLTNAGCRSTDAINIITLNVLSCGFPLATELLSFQASLNSNSKSVLSWSADQRDDQLAFDVEKSIDGIAFNLIHTEEAASSPPGGISRYAYTDPVPLNSGRVFYRIRMYRKDQAGQQQYSRTVSLSKTSDISLIQVTNPFGAFLSFRLASSEATTVTVSLSDMSGKAVLKKTLRLFNGINDIQLDDTRHLPDNVYILGIEAGGKRFYQKVVKTSRYR